MNSKEEVAMTDKIRKSGLKDKKKYFLAVTNTKENYKLYFINNSDNHIKELVLKLPGMTTFDAEIIKASNKDKVFKDIEPNSYIFIDDINKMDLKNFIDIYYFKIVTDKEILNLQGILKKRIDFTVTHIPHLDKQGKIIYLDKDKTVL